MTKRLQVYESPEITVTFDPNVCIHSGCCVATLPAVFDVRRQRWVRPEAASADAVADAVAKCPSRALRYYRNVSRDPSAESSLTRAILLNQLAMILAAESAPDVRAREIAEAVRAARDYRWVGIYTVGPHEIAVAGFTGEAAPVFPRFPVTQGLNGAAVSSGEAVVINNVAEDPRYLTAFGSTRSEMVVPVIHPATREVVGTIDVESERVNAFTDDDRALVEDCARAIVGFWE
jgi:L-methionine (R)-S-oxide reductase